MTKGTYATVRYVKIMCQTRPDGVMEDKSVTIIDLDKLTQTINVKVLNKHRHFRTSCNPHGWTQLLRRATIEVMLHQHEIVIHATI